MEALTGSRSRKRKSSNSSDSEESKKFVVAAEHKEIIPSIFKSCVSFNRRKVESEHLLKPDDLQTLKDLPCDTEVALLNLRSSFPVEIFEGRLPPVFLYSQLSSLVHNRAKIDHELKKLASGNKILTFSLFSSSNYLIVFYSDFVAIKRKGAFRRFVADVLGDDEKTQSQASSSSSSASSRIVSVSSHISSSSSICPIRRSTENSKLISKEALMKKWKFEEDEVRQLVNAGYLGVQDGAYYCISLPAAGEFIKIYEKGKKAVVNAIKRAKFGEILEKELEQRPMKKTAPLGVSYHIFDLVGSGEAVKVDTTSGPLLRIKRELLPL